MNGETCVIYTTSEGGLYKTVRASAAEYEQAVELGQWDETPNDIDCPPGRDMVDLKMIALLRIERNHDFVLGGDRDKPETWHPKYRRSLA